MQVFICYSRVDKAFAEQLYNGLSDYDLHVWMDVHKIPTGINWDIEVQKGLDASDAMLVLLSPSSVISENVIDEYSYFIDKNRLILPLLIAPCEVPFRLLRRQWIDFTMDYKLGFQQLVRALGSPALLDPESTQQLGTVKLPIASPLTTRPAEPSPRQAAPAVSAPRTTPAQQPVAPEVGVKMLPVVWSDSYHWLNGMGSNATGGDLMISSREVKFIPRAKPIIAIPLNSIVSAQLQRSIDQYIKLTYYNSQGQFQSIVLMGGPANRRQALNQEILNFLKLVTGRSLD